MSRVLFELSEGERERETRLSELLRLLRHSLVMSMNE